MIRLPDGRWVRSSNLGQYRADEEQALLRQALFVTQQLDRVSAEIYQKGRKGDGDSE